MGALQILITRDQERTRPLDISNSISLNAMATLRSVMVAEYSFVGDGVAHPGAGEIFIAWQNPCDVDILVWLFAVNYTVAGAGAADIGVATSGLAADNTANLCDGQAVGIAWINNYDNPGTDGKAIQLVNYRGGTTDYINGVVSGASVDMAGTAYIFYTPIDY